MKPKIKIPKGWDYVRKGDTLMEGDKYWRLGALFETFAYRQLCTTPNKYIRRIKKRGEK